MTKYILSALIGAILILSVDYIYHKFVLTYIPVIKYSYYSPVIEKEKKLDVEQLSAIKTSIDLNEEKIGSINKRIDDFYILMAVIITLLLIINLAVYVKTESEVDRHMNEHFGEYEIKIKEHLTNSQLLLGQIQGMHKVAKELSNKNKPSQTPS